MSNIKPNHALQVQNTDRQLALAGQVSKQLVLNDERQRWVALLLNIDSGHTVTLISRRFSLALVLLERFEGRWHWKMLSQNQSLPWSLALLERFEGCWHWKMLSQNQSLPWSLALLERFEDRWNWGHDGLSGNQSLPWSLALLERFKDRWDWDHLSGNKSLPTPVLSEQDIDKIMSKIKNS